MSIKPIEVVVGADIDDLLDGLTRSKKSLGDFRDQLKRFQQQLESATDPKSILRLNKAIEASVAKIKTLQNAGKGGFDGIAKGSDQAGQALLNLGRVAQDAPFGFIGIANNLNPLLESFQRLRKESGSAGGALKALVGSLSGGAGIGLAFSAVTAAISFASIGLQAWGGRNKEVKVAVDENKKATDEFAKSLERVRAEGIASGIQLQNFVNIAKDQSQSLSTRNEALKEANKILGDHGDKLTLVNVATAAVTKQIEAFTQATIQQALATKFADRAADLFINQKDAAKKYGDELAKLRAIEKKTLSFENAQGVQVLTDAGKEAVKQRAVVADIAANYRDVTTQVKSVVSELGAAQLAAAKLFGSLNPGTNVTGIIAKIRAEIKSLSDIQPTLISEEAITENVNRIKVLEAELNRLLGKPEKAAKAAKETIGDVLAELAREIDFLNAKEIAFNTNETKSKLTAYFGTIEKLIKDFKVDPDGTLINKLFGTAADIKIQNLLKSIRTEVEAGLIAAPLEIPITFTPPGKDIGTNLFPSGSLEKVALPSEEEIAAVKAKAYLAGVGITKGVQDGLQVGVDGLRFPELIALAKSVEDKIAAITVLMKDSFFNVAVSFGEGIGKAIATGSSFLTTALGGVFSIMGDFLIELGKAAIISSKLFLAIAASKTNPFTGIIGGILAIAAGSVLKNIKLPAFATGGTSPGGAILVGERGPEVITPPRGSVITPNAQTNAMLAGGTSGGRVVFEIEGRKLVGVLQQANNFLGRNGQL